MRIAPEHIQDKAVAGKTKAGHPILYVLTKGGLHAFFIKNDDGIESIGAAPHRAVAEWIAEKKYPGLEWDSEFVARQGLEKSEKATFDRVRALMFSDQVLDRTGELSKAEDVHFVYDPIAKVIEVMSMSQLRSQISKREWSFVRPVDLSAPVDIARYVVAHGR